MHTASAALISCLALSCLGSSMAQARCAEDLTRIQMNAEKAASDLQARLNPLVTEAQAKAKAMDFAGCEAATSQALRGLQLPVLPPVQLSTPMASAAEPAHANKPSGPAVVPAKAPLAEKPELEGTAAGRVVQSQPRQVPAADQNRSQPTSGQPQAAGTQSQSGFMPQVGQSSTTDSQEHPLFLSSRELIGTEVVDRENTGRTLGRVDSLIIDLASGRTLYVTLKPDTFLGWERDRIVVPYNVVSFSGRWDRPTLRVPASKIENAPRVRDRDLYNLVNDPDWRRAVASYFGSSLSEAMSGAGSLNQANAEPTGPRQSASEAAGGPPARSSLAGAVSDLKAQPGEGATNPKADSGSPAATTAAALEPAPAGTGGPDPKHGQALAQRDCAACHTLNQGGATRVGPNLFGVTVRPIASVAGYNYSNALKAHQGNWDASNIDAFLKNPRGYAPGTYMTFPGISSDRDRRDLVAYLESLKAGAPK